MDDDVYLCAPHIFERIYNVRSPKLYYGWKYGGNNDMIDPLTRVDEMFVTLGMDLVQRLTKRRFCGWNKQMRDKICKDVNNSSHPIISSDNADIDIASWLSIYKDIDRISDNRKMVHYHYTLDHRIRNIKYAIPELCVNNLLFHKTPIPIMYRLHHYNKYFRSGNSVPISRSVNMSRDVPNRIETFSYGIPVTKNDKICENWAIFHSNEAFFAKCVLTNLNDWCSLLVFDNLKRFPHTKYGNLVVLSPIEHEKRFPALSDVLNWNHTGRRNIGYMYALFNFKVRSTYGM